MYSKKDLKRLSSSRALELLLRQEVPDFPLVLQELQFETKLKKLQIALNQMQSWIVRSGSRVAILVEGSEFAGRGSLIRACMEHMNPRNVRLVALDKPTEKEKSQWYFKRYIASLPEQSEIVFFDRSWYNRAVVEPVNGFCSPEQHLLFMEEVLEFEKMLLSAGTILVKIHLTISRKEQALRIEHVKQNPLRRWELSAVDLNAVRLYDRYHEYQLKMFKLTGIKQAPWQVIEGDVKPLSTLKAMKYILKSVPWEKLPEGS
ncbi:MAG TPA: polyphosphate kinase 2 [Saprospiraceae bacterium]|nr:polyphosphate kinase 2 [Saprospiraceae bacterium]HPG05547.1 polyphosphate kinase 2 [Saprospiraceae bacterium]HRV85054.1 polyphosphate kinase 2 [Saprospiraceae bacterium]